MIKIDLITGFLGSGKTTFIKGYVRYLMEQGLKIGILENDYGAVNVDMMLLQELESEQCGLEMVAGGCDADCHRRRFKTKLIALGMSGYDRVIVEPSGIFDVDEFFDALYEEPLCRWYEIGSVIAIVDAGLEEDLSEYSDFLLASQIAEAGKIVLSRSQDVSEAEIDATILHINRAMERVKCDRRFSDEIIVKDWRSFTALDYEGIINSGYVLADYRKDYRDSEGYSSLYFMNMRMSEEELRKRVECVMNSQDCGNIVRIKGFMQMEDESSWIEVNATHKEIRIQRISRGQEILIVIGEKLVEPKIRAVLTDGIEEGYR